MSDLLHITLTTGHARLSPRAEVRDDVIALIDLAVAGGGKIEGTPWRIRPVESPDGVWIFDLLYHGRRIVACWLCTAAATSDQFWAQLASLAPEGVILTRPSQTPWLAAAIVPDKVALLWPNLKQIMGEAGDLERCIAWSIIESQDKPAGAAA